MRSIRWLVYPLVVAAVALLPWLLFLVQEEHRLGIAVVDKTVPYANYLEHRSLFRLLDQLKMRRVDGSPYRHDVDYIGVTPASQAGDKPTGMRTLDEATALAADVVYLTDTYGVYEEDLVSGSSMRAALERSRKICGGLEPAEARAVETAWKAGRTVLAEFNTMASPTGAEAREILEGVAGVRWTHWIGRYFPALEDTSEVPQWLRTVYEREWNEPWAFTGAGYVLTQDDMHCEVLRVGHEAQRIPLSIERSRPIDPVLEHALDDTPYSFWWEWVEAGPRTEVLASYVWHLTEAGEARLAERGLPLRMPAVTRHRAPVGGQAYYFAGDFADGTIAPRSVPLAGFLTLRRTFERLRRVPDQQSFYYRFYAPMLQEILQRERFGQPAT